ncbi:hypothetical protein ACFXG4_04835 [Nocardia sp. NPDC059246]|uniref:hypothetical protein n=1 Tax=unclassified Nocardia TaxID=2637762 RepID=UPI00368E8741
MPDPIAYTTIHRDDLIEQRNQDRARITELEQQASHRIIETASELDALPLGSVVLDFYAAGCTRVHPDRDFGWVRATSAVKERHHFHRPYLPAIVLWQPEVDHG